MVRDGDGLVFSPSDLTTFLGGEFGSWMDRWAAERDADPELANPWPAFAPFGPDGADETDALLQARGAEHEMDFLDELRREGRQVVEIPRGPDAVARTLRALRAGADAVYQGALEHDGFRGSPDVLLCEESASDLGPYAYTVWDAKLARSPKPADVIQLCAYADLLAAVQGVRPPWIHFALGTGEKRRLATDAYFFYYRELRARYLRFQTAFDPTRRVHPGDSPFHGRWSELAERLRERTDHLSRVARITRGQIAKLESAGLPTVAALVASTEASVPGIAPGVFARLRDQARLQSGSREAARPLFQVIRPAEDDPRRGLALLPPPSDGDVFFDMEGYPFAGPAGLEYLFGVCYRETGVTHFQDWWANSPLEEKEAFEAVVDWVVSRRRQDPAMHVYHYAAYERTALKRLAATYGTREEEVDDFLRGDVLVDVYSIVRHGLLAGTASYSLKDLEALYDAPDRGEAGVRTAAESVIAYQRWLDAPDGGTWRESATLRGIRDYNRTDCESLAALTAWLRKLQAREGIAYLPPLAAKADGNGEDPLPAAPVRPARALAERLLAEAERGAVPAEHRAQQTLLAWLLEFHRREEKPMWWRMFDRQAMTDEELADDMDCLSRLARTLAPPVPVNKSRLYEYAFDRDEDTTIGDGAKCRFAHDLKSVRVGTVDREAGRLTVKLGPSIREAPPRMALIPDEKMPQDAVEEAIRRYAEAWANGADPSPALDDFLARRPPRIAGHAGGPLVADGEDVVARATDLVRRMDRTTLCIQGPPGSGKTYLAAHVIVRLLEEGRRVGVLSNGHKAITNLLVAAARTATVAARRAPFYKVGPRDGEPDPILGEFGIAHVRTNGDAAGAIDPRGAVLVGGTVFLFAQSEWQDRLDYLFVDEAGQVAAANLVAAGLAARNLVLIGDQMQLAQPLQGVHPEGSGCSVLEHLLGEAHTVPPEMGVFLGTSWRMHPDVCRFVSDAFYEGRLGSHPRTAAQRVEPLAGSRVTRPTGIAYVPVEHDGNRRASDEEVAAVEELVRTLVGGTVQDRDGRRRPLTAADVIVVAPYNAQVRRLQQALGGAIRVGSVDKFQGQEAPVVIVSMAASCLDDAPRGADFLLNPNRLNVAVSRAQALAVVVASPALLAGRCATLREMALVNVYCRLTAYAASLPAAAQATLTRAEA